MENNSAPLGQKNSPADGLMALRQALPTGAVDDELRALVESWRASARARYECAGRTDDLTGRRVMNSTAMTYLNCSEALTAILAGASPQAQPNP